MQQGLRFSDRHYIDPPYNTGKDFVYKDNFHDSLKNYLQITGQVDSEGKKFSANTDSSRRYHTDWLNMIYPRLKLARNLLQDDGVIFISIDDNEIENMKKICNEIFGEDNFIVCISWQKIYSGKADATHFGQFHEYILCYAKNEPEMNINMLPRTDEMNARYKNPDNDPRGVWLSNDLTAAEERTNGHFDIVSPNGKVFDAPEGKHWLYAEAKMRLLIENNRIWFGAKGDAYPRLKRFLSDVQQGRKPPSVWSHSEAGHTDAATKEVKKLFPELPRLFETPKPKKLIKLLLEIGLVKENEIILDFFAGSCTTAHSVLETNADKNKKFQYIMVQLPELCGEDTAAHKAGFSNVAEIGKERIRRAIDIVSSEKLTDSGFKVFKLDSSNINQWESSFDHLSDILDNSIDSVKTERKNEDVLYEILLKYGLNLTYPITEHTLAGKTVYDVAFDSLIVCLDDGITRETVEAIGNLKQELDSETTRVVFKDAGFADDAVKVNAIQLLKQYGVNDVKSI